MRVLIVSAILALISSAGLASVNEVTKYCLDSTGYDRTAPIEERMKFDFTKASKCQLDYLADKRTAELAELRDFLKHNPRYRVPGQSLNRCWGKPREMPFEKSTISVGPDGMHAAVWYKDKLPAGCYENAPWDNRDVEN